MPSDDGQRRCRVKPATADAPASAEYPFGRRASVSLGRLTAYEEPSQPAAVSQTDPFGRLERPPPATEPLPSVGRPARMPVDPDHEHREQNRQHDSAAMAMQYVPREETPTRVTSASLPFFVERGSQIQSAEMATNQERRNPR